MDKKTLNLAYKLAYCQGLCNYCFNACLEEKDIQMMKDCIKYDKECAEICGTAFSLLSSSSPFLKDMLEVCVTACRKCGEECGKHQNGHCRECAKACLECENACKEYIADL